MPIVPCSSHILALTYRSPFSLIYRIVFSLIRRSPFSLICRSSVSLIYIAPFSLIRRWLIRVYLLWRWLIRSYLHRSSVRFFPLSFEMSFVVLSAEKNCTGVCVCMCVCVCCQLRMAACVGVHYSISLSFTSAPVGFPAEKGHLPVMMLLWVDAGPPVHNSNNMQVACCMLRKATCL